MKFDLASTKLGRAARVLLGGWLAVAAACAEGPAPPDADTPGSDPPVATNPPPTRPDPPATSNGSPPSPWIERDGCPFECCVYGQWETVTEVTVFAEEGDTSAVAFVIPAGQRFTAETGNVHVLRPGVAVATDTITLAADPAGPALRLEPGDTVHVLGHQGEGVFEMWRDGTVYTGEAFWAMMPLSGRPAAGRLVSDPATEWWVRVSESGGRRGWIEMGRSGQAVRGADACA